MCPVHEPAQVVPFEHSPESDAVADADRHPPCDIDVVRNQYRLPARQLHYESLVPRFLAVVRQQPDYVARVLDPVAVIALTVGTSDTDVSLQKSEPALSRHGD